MIKSFNNKTDKVGDDLKKSISTGSEIDIAASIFSIYAYASLKKELNKIKLLRFIFTDPTFIELDKNKREQRQFQINSNYRQKAISGSVFEINLKNELQGKAIAQECKKWIEQKVSFKTNAGNQYIQSHLNLKRFIKISDLYQELAKLNLSIYTPMNYILESQKKFYSELYDTETNTR